MRVPWARCTVPVVGGLIPVRMRSSDVLPTPFGPTRPTLLSLGRSTLMPLKMSRAPNERPRLRALIIDIVLLPTRTKRKAVGQDTVPRPDAVTGADASYGMSTCHNERAFRRGNPALKGWEEGHCFSRLQPRRVKLGPGICGPLPTDVGSPLPGLARRLRRTGEGAARPWTGSLSSLPPSGFTPDQHD